MLRPGKSRGCIQGSFCPLGRGNEKPYRAGTVPGFLLGDFSRTGWNSSRKKHAKQVLFSIYDLYNLRPNGAHKLEPSCTLL